MSTAAHNNPILETTLTAAQIEHYVHKHNGVSFVKLMRVCWPGGCRRAAALAAGCV